MKIRNTKTLKDGRRLVLVELAKNEAMPVPPLAPDSFYRLNYPHDEIMQGHHITNPARVYWDTLEQKWRDA